MKWFVPVRILHSLFLFVSPCPYPYINVCVYLCLFWSRLARTTDKVLFLNYFMTISIAGLYYVEGRVIYEQWISKNLEGSGHRIKSKAVPVTGHGDPYNCETSRLPRFLENRRWGCQHYASAAFYSSGRFLVLISIRGWVHPRDIVRLEGLGELKNPMTSSGIEPATFLNCATACSAAIE
jgi:hypothetical protein